MAARHAAIAAGLSTPARRALLDAQEWIRFRLPNDLPVSVHEELVMTGLVTGQYLTTRGEVVREYVLDLEIKP